MAPNTKSLECEKFVKIYADLSRKDIYLLTRERGGEKEGWLDRLYYYGRVSDCQAEGRGFKSHRPLHRFLLFSPGFLIVFLRVQFSQI